jgi:hypothetical protein
VCTCSAVRIPNKKETKFKSDLDLLKLLIFTFSHLEAYVDADTVEYSLSLD